jgi:parallel beta-helix repeat protein
MRFRGQILFFITAFILFMMAGPRTLLAADLIVNNAANAACNEPACFTTIQAAIDYANNIITTNTGTTVTYSILVEPGTYGEPVILKPGISTVRGRETARTILNNNGSTAAVTIGNLSTNEVSFRNFSFSNTSAGIAVSSSSAPISITNNVFYNTSGTAVTLQGAASTTVINNTFYHNGTAVVRDSVSNQITNNIFSNKINANISQSATLTAQDNITYNDFDPVPGTGEITGSNFIPNQLVAGGAFVPDFVNISDVSNLDFHLRTGSPCIDNGANQCTNVNQVNCNHDIGAYGGPNSDTIPMQVSNVTATVSTSISLAWNANLSYEVTGYRVWYGRTSGGPYDGTGATDGPSPISVPTGTAALTYLLSGLSTTVSTPDSPVLNPPSVQSKSLVLSWSAIPGATGYRVYYGESSLSSSPIEVGDVTTYTLSGLTNGQHYYIAVSAISQGTYYITVTAVNGINGTFTPGISNESAYSTEAIVGTGNIMESARSNVQYDYPEAIAAYPNLQNSRRGCFIATAAYGSYFAPEVRALREFRDQYLLTNRAGSAFVRWYYEYGPIAAAYLDAHPGYKPVVRTALMPAVGLALFMTSASLFIKAVVAMLVLIIAFMIANNFFRKRLSGSGGA